jgi:1-acyl-sn-glycerol-3-phosphate acyltransferase
VTFYGVVWWIVAFGSRLVWRVRIRGREHVPAQGACILAPSHRSMMDIPFLATTTRRRIRFMGKRQAFDWPVVGPLFVRLGSFPVERDGDDRQALRTALHVLEYDGEPLAVYPEGTRQHGRKIAPLQPGAAYMAIRAGVPIVPIGIAGAEEIQRRGRTGWVRRLPRLTRVAVVVGPAIHPPVRAPGKAVKRAAVDELTARLRDELQTVLDEAYELRGF